MSLPDDLDPATLRWCAGWMTDGADWEYLLDRLPEANAPGPHRELSRAYRSCGERLNDLADTIEKQRADKSAACDQADRDFAALDCATCGCEVLDHAVDDEERRECTECDCAQYVIPEAASLQKAKRKHKCLCTPANIRHGDCDCEATDA